MNKIKILNIINGLTYGGTEKRLLRLVNNLPSDRFVSRIVTLMPEVEGLQEKVNSGIIVDNLGASRTADIFRVIPRLVGIIRNFKPDIINSFLFHSNIIARLIGRLAGVRTIVSNEAGRDYENFFRAFLNRLTSCLSSHCLVVSEDLKNYIHNRCGIPKSRINVIYTGTDHPPEMKCSLKEMRKKLNLPEDLFIIGAVGRLHPVKGYNNLIEAFCIFNRSSPESMLVLVGDGPERKKIEDLSEKLGIKDKVFFAGMQEDIYSWIYSFDLLAISSLAEGIPNAAIEAFSCGCPVLATAVGGLPEIINSGENGWLVDPGNPTQMAETLIKISNNPELLKKISQQAINNYTEKFTTQLMINYFSDFFSSLTL